MDSPKDTIYQPVFLTEDERGDAEIATPIGVPRSDRGVVVLDDDSYLKYTAPVRDLRLLRPYKDELGKLVGSSTVILQFKVPFTLDSVPKEFVHKESSLLWRVKGDGFVGYITDKDLGCFFFPSESEAEIFLRTMNGLPKDQQSFSDAASQRDSLRKLLT